MRSKKNKLHKRKSRRQKGGKKTVAYVINLKDRKDRRDIISNKFKNSSIELEFFQVERHPDGPHTGTGDSFMKVIQKAKDLNLPSVLIFEDDNMPLDNFDERWIKVKEWLDSNKDKWEIFNGGARIYDNPDILLKYKISDDIYLFEMSQYLGLNWIYIHSNLYDKCLEWDIGKNGPIDRYFGNNSIFKNLCIYPYLGLQEVGISNSWGKHMNLSDNDKRMKNIFQIELEKQKNMIGGNDTIYIKKTDIAETEALYPFLKNIYPNKKIEFVDNREKYDLIVVSCLNGAPQDQQYILICGERYYTVSEAHKNNPNCIAIFLSSLHPDTKNLKNYYYFPLFLTIGHEIYNSSPFIRNYSDTPKTGLCAFVARGETEFRRNMFQALLAEDKTSTTHALGNALHNKDITLPEFWWDLSEVYKDYKFILAIENNDEDGYITEKIMNAYRASSIPIYWGTEKVKEIFNPKSFIFIKDYKKNDGSIDYESCAKEVVEIANDPKRYKKMQNEPIFNNDHYLSHYYDAKSPQWVLDISNDLKQKLNIQNGGTNYKEITLGILSWKSCKTLVQTLESYKKSNLLNLVEPLIYFQEISDVEKKLAEKYNVPFIGTDKNVGIQKALIELINSTKTKYFIFAENDFQLIHNEEIVKKVFDDCINLIDKHDIKIVKLRDIQNPGEPLYSKNIYINDFKDKPNQQNFRYKLEALSYVNNPEESFPNTFEIINLKYKWYKCSNNNNVWSNNVFIASTQWLKESVLPLLDYSMDNTQNKQMFEDVLINKLDSYNLAAGQGLFTHNRVEHGECLLEHIQNGGKKKWSTRKNKNTRGGAKHPKIHCITVSTKDNEKLQRLLKSAKKYNINIKVLGLDMNTDTLGHSDNQKFGMKLRYPLEYLNKIDENDIVLFTDGWDVIYIDNLDSIYQKYKKFNKPIVFGAELFAWPDADKASEYTDTQNEYFKYLNSGLYIGVAKDLKALLNNYKGGEDIDDQRFWVDMYFKNRDKIALDIKAELFLDAAGTDKNDYDFTSGSFIFKKTGTSPSVIHANSSDKTYLDLFNSMIGGKQKEITWFLPAYVPFVNAGAELMAHAINKYLLLKGFVINVVGPWEPQVYDKINYISNSNQEEVDKAIERSSILFAQQNSSERAVDLGNKNNKIVIIVVHNTERQFYDLEKFKTKIDPNKLFIVFNSSWVKEDYKSDLQSMVLHPPVNCKEYYTETNHKYVTLINVSELKGGNQLIEIAKRMPDIEFLGVEGGYDTQIRDDTVKNIKYVPNTQTIKDVYAETDILIMPSSAETWGRTATEALCSGIPVLANPTPGLKENLGDAGIFIDRNSIDEWVGTIRKLKDDRNYYKKVSEKCKQRSKELDSEPEFNTLLNKLNTYNGGSKNVLR